jgi:hypothetical protein
MPLCCFIAPCDIPHADYFNRTNGRCTTDNMFANLRFFADRYQRPLWLTEFDCERSVSCAARSSHVNPQTLRTI